MPVCFRIYWKLFDSRLKVMRVQTERGDVESYLSYLNFPHFFSRICMRMRVSMRTACTRILDQMCAFLCFAEKKRVAKRTKVEPIVIWKYCGKTFLLSSRGMTRLRLHEQIHIGEAPSLYVNIVWIFTMKRADYVSMNNNTLAENLISVRFVGLVSSVDTIISVTWTHTLG